jgi:hypothetical protein
VGSGGEGLWTLMMAPTLTLSSLGGWSLVRDGTHFYVSCIDRPDHRCDLMLLCCFRRIGLIDYITFLVWFRLI